MAAHNVTSTAAAVSSTSAGVSHGPNHRVTSAAAGTSSTLTWAYVLEVDGEITTIPYLVSPYGQ